MQIVEKPAQSVIVRAFSVYQVCSDVGENGRKWKGFWKGFYTGRKGARLYHFLAPMQQIAPILRWRVTQ